MLKTCKKIMYSSMMLLIFIVCTGCDANITSPSDTLRVQSSSIIVEYSAADKTYQSLNFALNEYKSKISSDNRINTMSSDNSDPLNELDREISSREIIKYATELEQICINVINSQNYLQQSSGKKITIEKYLSFSREILNKYRN